MENTLHVYGQKDRHDDVFVIGNVEGLKRLRDALNSVLSGSKNEAKETSFAQDGEGFNVYVKRVFGDELEKAHLPYADGPGEGSVPYRLMDMLK